jgi:hypothetical protein
MNTAARLQKCSCREGAIAPKICAYHCFGYPDPISSGGHGEAAVSKATDGVLVDGRAKPGHDALRHCALSVHASVS